MYVVFELPFLPLYCTVPLPFQVRLKRAPEAEPVAAPAPLRLLRRARRDAEPAAAAPPEAALLGAPALARQPGNAPRLHRELGLSQV